MDPKPYFVSITILSFTSLTSQSSSFDSTAISLKVLYQSLLKKNPSSSPLFLLYIFFIQKLKILDNNQELLLRYNCKINKIFFMIIDHCMFMTFRTIMNTAFMKFFSLTIINNITITRNE